MGIKAFGHSPLPRPINSTWECFQRKCTLLADVMNKVVIEALIAKNASEAKASQFSIIPHKGLFIRISSFKSNIYKYRLILHTYNILNDNFWIT